MSRAENHLIVFTRFPCIGRNKTRLIPALGEAGASEFHERLVRHTLGRARSFCSEHPETLLVVRLDGGSSEEGRRWLGDCDCREQGVGDLGVRLELSVREAFAEGARRVVILGTDCPELDEATLAEAFSFLNKRKLVFGPALDGGYYLVGLAEPCAAIFQNITWGGAEVLNQSLAAAVREGIVYALLKSLPDVDVPEDLTAAFSALRKASA